MDRHEWIGAYGTRYMVDRQQHDEGINADTEQPAGEEVLAAEILRLAEEVERLKAYRDLGRITGEADRHEWTDEGFALSLESSCGRYTLTYNGDGGGYRTWVVKPDRNDAEGFLCRAVLRFAAEVERLKAEVAGLRYDLERSDEAEFAAGAAEECARIRRELLERLAECSRHPVGGFISAEGYQRGILAAEAAVRFICPEEG